METDHHYIYGETTDFLTGQTLTDTHDERYRQKIAQFLVEEKGYSREDVLPRQSFVINTEDCQCRLSVDFAIQVEGKTALIIRYAPGSLVTRQRPCLAATRLLEPYQIPLVVVTNGEDSDLLDAQSGKVLASGLEAIPSRKELPSLITNAPFTEISGKRREMESRIIFTFEKVGACNCDIC